MNYSSYQSQLATLMATSVTDADFQTILPACIDYAELRIYRELDLLNTRYRDATSRCTAGSRELTLPATLMVLETLAIVTPTDTLPPAGARSICVPVTHDFLDMVYGSDASASQAVPQYFAPFGQSSVVLGPCPDQGYGVEIVGTYRPLALSVDNTVTPLTDLLPDLFMAASAIYMAGYMKNFGAQADDPKMAQSWEEQYQLLLKGAQSEEFRKKFQSSSWTSRIASPVAVPQRG